MKAKVSDWSAADLLPQWWRMGWRKVAVGETLKERAPRQAAGVNNDSNRVQRVFTDSAMRRRQVKLVAVTLAVANGQDAMVVDAEASS